MNLLSHRLYERYASSHAGRGDGIATTLVYRRDIQPHLPAKTGGRRILDIGCGQGELVRLLHADGFDVHGVDISPEQVHIAHAAGVDRVVLGDFDYHLEPARGNWDAVLATDVLEHLPKAEVMRTFDRVRHALRPDGIFLGRVPNAVSPTGGHIMYGDVTHETWFTTRSITQFATAAGFTDVKTFACPPITASLAGTARRAVWKPISGLFKLALAAETGQLRGHIVTQNLVFIAKITS
jgi:2-polyprenyl-3-methyl-5-hydroxy-6-metoxy-1,4-benzoquinol methylase